MSKLDDQVRHISGALNKGVVLAVDPSSGSKSSMPAYALAVKGVLVEANKITLDTKLPLHLRLNSLLTQLRKMKRPDVLVVEGLPPYMSSGGSSFRTQGVVSLLQSLGVVMACWDVDHLVEVTPQSWHGFIVKHFWDKEGKPSLAPAALKPEFQRLYNKSDVNDAVAILMTAFGATGVELGGTENFEKNMRGSKGR